MMHSRALFSPAEALLQVFCQKTAPKIAPKHLRLNGPARNPYSPACTKHGLFVRSQHTLQRKSRRVAADPFEGVTRNEAIITKEIQIRTEDGKLLPSEPLLAGISRLRSENEHLVQLNKLDETIAICKIMTTDELFKRRRTNEGVAKQQKKSAKQSIAKQIELNWAISTNDLGHKLSQMKAFLEDGRKVEVVLADRKRQRKATEEEGQEVLRSVRKAVEEAGASETKPAQGIRIGNHTVLTVTRPDSN